MSDSASNIKSGFFVVIGLILLVLSVLFFGGERSFFSTYNKYKIKLRSAQGLGVGSVVSISGKTAGNVSEISFTEDGSLLATVKVEDEFAFLLNEKSLASLRTQGALGDKYIYIEPGPLSENSLPENSMITTDQQPDLFDVIAEKASDLSAFTETVQELNKLLVNINSGNKSALLMENLVLASHNISKMVSEPEIRSSLTHLKSVLQKIDSGQGTLGQLVNDPALYNQLVSLMGEEPRSKFLKPLLREAIIQNEKKR